MITSVLIITVSAALFMYWFRYSCLLILSARTARDYSGEIAAARRLRFAEVSGALEELGQSSAIPRLDALQRALNSDYRVLCTLLRHSDLTGAGAWLESFMIRADYHLLRGWYAASRLVWPVQAKAALTEMSEIVRYIANSVGEQRQSVRA